MKTGLSIVPRLVALGTGIFFLLVFLNWAFGHGPQWSIKLVFTFFYVQLYTFGLYFANAAVFRYLDRKFEGRRFDVKRIALGFAMSFVVSLAVVFLLRAFEEVAIERRPFSGFVTSESIADYAFAIGITFVLTLSAYAIGFYKAYKENQVKEQQLIAGTASAQFESLKNQIDPHFLFNSLNVLSSLIEENPDAAQKFTTSLSKVYRYVLEQKDKELISVAEELKFAKTYMNLLKMRFENSVYFELPEGDLGEDWKVVPLSLQLLLENTVKHNVVSEQRPLRIGIYVDKDYLCIANELQKKEVLQDRKGVGLQNIVDRYAILTRRKVLIEQNERTFTVRIPILTKQITVMETQFNEEQASFYHAQKKVAQIKEFYGNLLSYVIINTGLMVLNLMTSAQYLWFLWSAVGWGVGLAIHAMKVFDFMPFLGNDWEERKIRQLMDKDKTNKWN